MQANTDYKDLMGEISGFLRMRVRAIVEAGADEKALIIDPGIGFAKTTQQNLEILTAAAGTEINRQADIGGDVEKIDHRQGAGRSWAG